MTRKPLHVYDNYIENSQKYLAYLIKESAEDCFTFNGDYIINPRLRIIFDSICRVVDKKLKLELDILLDECKQIDSSFEYNELKIIADSFDDFENIENVKKRLKENYHKQVTNKTIMEEILTITGASDDLDMHKMKGLSEQLTESISEIESDENSFMFFSDMSDNYRKEMKRREDGTKKRSCGLYALDPYYRYAGEPGDMMTIAMQTGNGKCITEDSLILTDKGFEYINAYSNGENGYHQKEQTIYSDNGENITSHFYEEVVDKTIKIKTKWGFNIEGTFEHPIKILNTHGRIEFKKLSEVKEHDSVCIQIGQMVFGKDSKIDFKYVYKNEPNTKKIIIPEYLTPELSRFLGYYIANGSMNHCIDISTKNTKIIEDIKDILKRLNLDIGKISSSSSFRIHSVQFRELIKYLIGNQYNKENFTARYKAVPEFILKGSKENQIEFLRGLFDCDSYKVKGQDKIEYYTASEKLTKEVQLMLLNLGIFSYKKEKYLEEYKHIYNTLIISSEDYDKLLELFDYKSFKYDLVKSNKQRNTNIKVIPYVGELTLKNIKSLWGRLNANKRGFYYDGGNLLRLPFGKINTLLGKPLTYSKLNKIYNILIDDTFFHKYPEIKELLEIYKNLISSNFMFDEIINKNIKKDKIKVYDFTIPKEHSFYSNGFISHNTSLILNMMNYLVNNGVCCVYFSLDMGEVPVLERFLCIREGLTNDELHLEEKDPRLQSRIERGMNRISKLKNFIYYPHKDLSLDKLDRYLYQAKAHFRKLGVLPDDEYMVIALDTNDIIEDFSGKEADIEKAVNKLHVINDRHKIFTINLVQLNENKIRGKSLSPESVDKMYFTKEDIFGSSAYNKRSRLILVGQRNKHMKLTLFPDHEDRGLWELEQDILQLSVVKQNDGPTPSLPFIFDSSTYKIIPKPPKENINDFKDMEKPID